VTTSRERRSAFAGDGRPGDTSIFCVVGLGARVRMNLVTLRRSPPSPHVRRSSSTSRGAIEVVDVNSVEHRLQTHIHICAVDLVDAIALDGVEVVEVVENDLQTQVPLLPRAGVGMTGDSQRAHTLGLGQRAASRLRDGRARLVGCNSIELTVVRAPVELRRLVSMRQPWGARAAAYDVAGGRATCRASARGDARAASHSIW
jgi:hypothetical protein